MMQLGQQASMLSAGVCRMLQLGQQASMQVLQTCYLIVIQFHGCSHSVAGF